MFYYNWPYLLATSWKLQLKNALNGGHGNTATLDSMCGWWVRRSFREPISKDVRKSCLLWLDTLVSGTGCGRFNQVSDSVVWFIIYWTNINFSMYFFLASISVLLFEAIKKKTVHCQPLLLHAHVVHLINWLDVPNHTGIYSSSTWTTLHLKQDIQIRTSQTLLKIQDEKLWQFRSDRIYF